MVRWSLKLAEYNVEIIHRAGKENVVADALSRNPQGGTEVNEKVDVCVLSSMVLNSREQLIQEQKDDPEFGGLYKYLEGPDDFGSMNAAIFEKWSQSFKLIDGLLFYSKFTNSRGELKVFIPASLRKAILKEFHDNPLAGHLGMRKTYARMRDSCYFPKMRKIVREYVASCNTCQKFNYRNVSPAGKLISIMVTYPMQKVGLDLIGPYPISNPERYRYVLVIVDYFSKWVEFVPLRKASAKAVADAFFNNFVSKYGAPLEIVSDHGSCFISEIFKAMCEKLRISHIFTVPYRPQSNMSERVNRTLIQMISSYIGSQHSTWDLFLQHFAFALRTAVHESTGKTPAELFLGRKIITLFQRLVMVTDSEDEFVCQNLNKLVEEAQMEINKAQKRQALYYNLKRRELKINVGDFVLLEKHWLSSSRDKRVAKFGPKFVGPFQVLKVVNNNLVLDVEGERRTVNLDQVRVYKFRSDSESSRLSGAESQHHLSDTTISSYHSSLHLPTEFSKNKLPAKVYDGKRSSSIKKRTVNDNITLAGKVNNFRHQSESTKFKRTEVDYRNRPQKSPQSSLCLYKPEYDRYKSSNRTKRSHYSDSTKLDPAPKRRRRAQRKRPAPSTDVSGASRKRFPPPSSYWSTRAARPQQSTIPRTFGTRNEPTHPYRTRLQARQAGCVPPYESEQEKAFIQRFWNRKKQSSQSLQPSTSESSL